MSICQFVKGNVIQALLKGVFFTVFG